MDGNGIRYVVCFEHLKMLETLTEPFSTNRHGESPCGFHTGQGVIGALLPDLQTYADWLARHVLLFDRLGVLCWKVFRWSCIFDAPEIKQGSKKQEYSLQDIERHLMLQS